MREMPHDFDPECLSLARYFLTDEPARLAKQENDLAQAIQDAIEQWFEDERDEDMSEDPRP